MRHRTCTISKLAYAAVLAIVPAGLRAGEAIALTRVSATAPNAGFRVDQQWFTGPALFSWPAGSKHTLSVPLVQDATPLPDTRFLFQHWSSPLGELGAPSNEVVITADPAISWYNADVMTEYAMTVSYYPCPGQPCAAPGTVWINKVAYIGNVVVWGEAGANVIAEATPNTGYVFTGWAHGGSTLPVIYAFVLNAPVALYPQFSPARSVTFTTVPPGLQVLADRAPLFTPATLEWGFYTTHSLGVPSPQRDTRGVAWVFRSWSDGGAMVHDMQVEAVNAPASVEARFVRDVRTSVFSDPEGLKLSIDGADMAAPQSFDWGVGELHNLTAPLHQIDSAGAPWVFRAWSNGGASQQALAISEDNADSGIRLTAVYDPLSRIRVESVPSGIVMTLDGSSCQTPCEIERGVGAAVQVSAPLTVDNGNGVRYDFANWTGMAGGVFRAKAGLQTITARYHTLYRLATATVPADGGSWQVTPTASDGFFPAGTTVTVAFTAAEGMRFRGWELDLSGSANPASLLMNTPYSVRAIAEAQPPLPAPPKVTNLATAAEAVAPGSLAMLSGAGLANGTASSTANPLPQILGGIVLVCEGRFLPLLYVSPEQIHFQVPGDLAPGSHTLQLHRENRAVLETGFTVALHAPGLMAAFHDSGAEVKDAAPARAGERITLYGTGFGPYLRNLPDGFSVPANPPDPLLDAVEVLAGDRVLTPEFAGAAPGLPGVVCIRVVLPEDWSEAVDLDMLAVIGGAASNPLVVPVR